MLQREVGGTMQMVHQPPGSANEDINFARATLQTRDDK